ncbi:MAG: S41 family peptidase [Pseudomonadota bacterium]
MHTLFRLSVVAPLVALVSSCAIVDPNRLTTRTHVPLLTPSVPVPIPDENWRRDALDFVWTTVNERYYDPKLNGVDWQAVRRQYEPRILAAASDDEYWELLDKMTGELKDAHTRVHSPKLVQQQRNNESHSLGVGFAELDGDIIVTSVHPQSDAFWAGVRAGMVIQTIDGEPAMPLYQHLVSEARNTSTPWARTRGAVRKINAGDVGTSVDMVFLRGDKSTIDVTMKRRTFASLPELSPRVLPSGFGYIRFSNFAGGLEANIIREIAQMKDTPGMIIDLRNNGGGSAEMSANLLNLFFRDEQKGVTLLTRTGKPFKLFFIDVMKMQTTLKGSKEKAYTKPVVLLTNENSASASEVFAVVMKESGRATLIGARTCGCLLGFLGLADIPGGAQMAYSEIGFVTQNGSRVEGEGVTPHIAVTPSREDYSLNRDRVLERAVAYLAGLPKADPVVKTN